MIEKYALLFIDKNELVFQFVFVNSNHKIFTIPSRININKFPQPEEIILAYADLASSEDSIGVIEWRVCARDLPPKLLKIVSQATNLKIELLSKPREQNLICQGLAVEI